MTSAPETDSTPPVLQATLKPPPVFSPGVVILVGFGLLFLAGIWLAPADVPVTERSTMALLVAALTLSPVLFAYRISQNSGRRNLSLFPDRLTLPLTASSTHMLSVPLKELTGVMLFSGAGRSFVLIGTGPIDFIYPLRAFERSEDAERFVTGLKERLRSSLPHGDRTVDVFEVEGERAASALGRVPWFTLVTLATMAGVAVHHAFTGLNEDPFGPMLWGSLSRSMLLEGDWYRLFSYAFVHPAESLPGPLIHFAQFSLALCVASLLMVGPSLERLVGPWGATLCFGAGSMVAAGLVSFTWSDAVVAGAAGGWFGLVGGAAFLWTQARERLPLGFRSLHRMGFWVGLVGILWVILPQVRLDLALGGLLGGVVAIYPFAGRSLPTEAPPWIRALALGVVAFHGAGLLGAFAGAEQAGRNLPNLIQASLNANRLNHFAWETATAEEPSPEHLELAEEGVRRALGLLGNGTEASWAFEDTLATVLFRRGQMAEAIELEQEVLDRVNRSDVASQLGRFLLHSDGIRPSRTSTLSVELSAFRSDDGRIGIRRRLNETMEASERVTAYGTLHTSGEPVAVFRVEIPPSQEDGEVLLDTPQSIEGQDGALEVRGVWLRTGGGKNQVWPFDPEVRGHPNRPVR